MSFLNAQSVWKFTLSAVSKSLIDFVNIATNQNNLLFPSIKFNKKLMILLDINKWSCQQGKQTGSCIRKSVCVKEG